MATKPLRSIGSLLGPKVPFLFSAALFWAVLLDVRWFFRIEVFLTAALCTWGGVIIRDCRFRPNLLKPFVLPLLFLAVSLALEICRRPTGFWALDAITRRSGPYLPPSACLLGLVLSWAILVARLKARRQLALRNPLFRAHGNPIITEEAAQYFEVLAVSLRNGFAELHCVRDAAAKVPDGSLFSEQARKIEGLVGGGWKLSEALEYVFLAEPAARIPSYLGMYVYGLEVERACALVATEIRQFVEKPQSTRRELAEVAS